MNTLPDTKHAMKALPGGTVTFLFTDIEGSTRLLQILGDKYSQVLTLQRQVLRAAFESWQGQEVDTQGDAFFVAFGRASDAICAAAQAQEILALQEWPGGMTIKVRMGVHTGEARLTQEGYVGIDVHRASRICSAGHGGQILVSPSTATLVLNNLPENLHLHDLGEHRLKDLSFPEHLYQLDIAGLPCEFPPLKSLNSLPNNLPAQLTSFIGRLDEIEQLKRLLGEVRLITITGPGGSGKSRLSIQTAADMIEHFSDGVWFVPLSTVVSIDEIPAAIANNLHFRIENFSTNVDLFTQLADYLSNRSLLLVLDNFEHLLAGAGYLRDILSKAPHIKVMLTSRECLNIPEEWVFTIPGLGYPKDGHKNGNGSYAALLLFQDRARQTNPSFIISPSNHQHAARICRLVGGMPLAIELAAPWTAILTCQEIAQEIENNLDFLSDTLRGLPEGHKSVRAVFEHSWNLLTEVEHDAFCSLAVFEGGFDRHSALQICGINLPMLLNLVNKSLVQRGEGDRFQLHILLRQFATEKIPTQHVDEQVLKEKHSRYYIKILEDWQNSKPGDDWLLALEKIQLETGNLRQMIHWALLHWDVVEGNHVIDCLGPFYLAEGFHNASKSYASIITFLNENGISLDADTPRRTLLLNAIPCKATYDAGLGDPNAQAAAKECMSYLGSMDNKYELGLCLYTLGVTAINDCNYPQAIPLLEESRSLIENTGHPETVASNLLWLGWAYQEIGNIDQAKLLFQESYDISMQQGVGVLIPYALDKLGMWADAVGNPQLGLQYHLESLKYHKVLGALSGQAYALSRMSVSAWALGDYAQALQYAQEGYECFKSIGHRWGMAISPGRMGYAELGLESYAEARIHFLQGLKSGQEYNMFNPTVYAMIGLALLESRQGDPVFAVETLTAALEHPMTPSSYKPEAQKELEMLKTKMDDTVYIAAQEYARTAGYQAIIDQLNKPLT